MNFSQRQGLSPIPSELQIDAMSGALRASLWNVLHREVWDVPGFRFEGHRYGWIISFSRELWFRHFKQPFSRIPDTPSEIMQVLEAFFMKEIWYGIYDFIESVLSIVPQPIALSNAINAVLERELAGYRLVETRFIPVTSADEVRALEEALRDDRFAPVGQHLRSALALMSDRKNPDYRNSIKESISAVEAMAKLLSGLEKASLDDALKALEKKGRLHRALRQGFSSLYGYTSDADGIRHAMMEEPNLSAADAKFFLLSCTSFANYLKAQI